MITADYQYEYNGLTIGHATPYFIESIAGLISLPKIVTKNSPRQGAHGSFPGSQTMEERVVDIDLYVIGEGGMAAELHLEMLGAHFHPRNDEVPFIVRRPGRQLRRLYSRISRADFDTGYAAAKGLVEGSMEFICADPRFYSEQLYGNAIQIPVGAQQAQKIITSTGKFPSSHIKVNIVGPCSNLVLSNVTSGRQLKTNVILGAMDTLIIDFYNRTATLNGLDNYNSIRTDSQWWELAPGPNTIAANRQDSGAACTVTIEHRDAWLI